MHKLSKLMVLAAVAISLLACLSCSADYMTLDSPHGYLTVANTTSHTVEIYVDGDYKGTVYGQRNKSWWVGTGSHSVTWSSSYGSGGRTIDCTESQTLTLYDS